MQKRKLPTTDLRSLTPSPELNPLWTGQEQLPSKMKQERIGELPLVDPNTGTLEATHTFNKIKYVEKEEFVKLFGRGLADTFELSGTAQRVFFLVLREYDKMPMTQGYVDWLRLTWVGKGLDGQDAGMSTETYRRGLRELIDKRFLALRAGDTFWVDPMRFFKGNRLIFQREFVLAERQRQQPLPSYQVHQVTDL